MRCRVWVLRPGKSALSICSPLKERGWVIFLPDKEGPNAVKPMFQLGVFFLRHLPGMPLQGVRLPFHPFRGLMQARVHTQPCTTASPRPFFSSWNSQLMAQPFPVHDSSVTSTYNLSGAVLFAFFPPDPRHLPLLPANRSVSQVFCLLKEGRSGPGPTPGGRKRAPRATWLH